MQPTIWPTLKTDTLAIKLVLWCNTIIKNEGQKKYIDGISRDMF